eukprot:c6649_g1_i1.p1 GENE.c6649_g1_i1~~c6649_g1_i1.p1  ORF type:complete len:434 (-),score=112.87 c6649_g1_i1:1-1263(-)
MRRALLWTLAQNRSFVTRKTKFNIPLLKPTIAKPKIQVEPSEATNIDLKKLRHDTTKKSSKSVAKALQASTAPATPEPDVDPAQLEKKRKEAKILKSGEKFDVGDTVYAIKDFDKLVGQYLLKDVVPDDIQKLVEKRGVAKNVDVSDVNMDQYKQAFLDALKEYHDTAEPDADSPKLSTSAKKPQKDVEDDNEPEVAQPSPPLHSDQLQKALQRARSLRQKIRKEKFSISDVMAQSDKQVRDEFALESGSFKTHIYQRGRYTPSDNRFDMLDVQKRKTQIQKSGVRQLRISERLLSFIDELHGLGNLFRAPELNESIIFSKVETSRDLRSAVFMWSFVDKTARKNIPAEHINNLLQQQEPKLRTLIARGVNMKYTPTLRFQENVDEIQDERVNRLLRRVMAEDVLPYQRKLRKQMRNDLE